MSICLTTFSVRRHIGAKRRRCREGRPVLDRLPTTCTAREDAYVRHAMRYEMPRIDYELLSDV